MEISKCPFMSGTQKQTAGGGASNRDWWPNELKLNILGKMQLSPILWEEILTMLKLLIVLTWVSFKARRY